MTEQEEKNYEILINNPKIMLDCLIKMKAYAYTVKDEILEELIEEVEKMHNIKIPIK